MKGVKDRDQRSIKRGTKKEEGGEKPRMCDRGEEGQHGTVGKKRSSEAEELESLIQGHFQRKTFWLKPGFEVQVCSMKDRKWVQLIFSSFCLIFSILGEHSCTENSQL